MTQTFSAARWRAIEALQCRRAKAKNTFKADVYDRAIDYLLNPSRPDNKFLLHNAYRNARWAILRDRKHPLKGGALPLEIEAPDGRVIIPHEEGPRADATYVDLLAPDPETMLMHREAAGRLRLAVISETRHGAKVWDDWAEGRAIAETAKDLAVSVRQVKKIRTRIKRCALGAKAA